MSAHTPGPWFLLTASGRLPIVREIKRPHGEASHYRAVVSTNDLGGGTTIANLDFGYGSPTDPTNAHLIAAAPELLAALKAITHRTSLGTALFHKLTEENAEAALAAIAKAEGR